MERPKLEDILKETSGPLKNRKAFDILIDDKPCPVWDLPDYEHENGKWNGTPTTWWLQYQDELIPYVDKGVHRICWEICYKQTNHTKYKWDDWDVRSSGRCTIKANGKEIYSFGSSDLGYALGKAQALCIELMEHPYNFLDQNSEEGRKIWYYGLPASISVNDHHPGEISIVPDLENIDENTWWKKYSERKKPILPVSEEREQDIIMDEENDEEWRGFGRIGHGDALWDGMINWFR